MDFLIAGLGNPGGKYTNTRHNIGFLTVDFLSDKWKSTVFESKFHSMCSRCTVDGKGIYLIKPQTFMNLSGRAVSQASRFYKIPLEKIIIIHDDIDLPFGKIKLKHGGGAGGHNGLKSIDQYIGNNYYRIRVGVGRPLEEEKIDVSCFVLSDFSKSEQEEIPFILEKVRSQIDLLISG